MALLATEFLIGLFFVPSYQDLIQESSISVGAWLGIGIFASMGITAGSFGLYHAMSFVRRNQRWDSVTLLISLVSTSIIIYGVFYSIVPLILLIGTQGALLIQIPDIILPFSWAIALHMLYWNLKTSPLEEMTAFPSVLVLLATLTFVWARAYATITIVDLATDKLLIAELAISLFLNVYTVILAIALLLGKQLRRLSLQWRLVVGLVELATLITLLREFVSYTLVQGAHGKEGETTVILLSLLSTLVFGLAVVSMDAGETGLVVAE